LVAKDQVAVYQQLSLLYGVVSPLLLAGVPLGLLYFISRAADDEERRMWISRGYLLLAAMGCTSAGIVVVLRHPIALLLNSPRLAPALVLYAPYFFFQFIAAATPPALVGVGRARSAALLNGCLGAFVFVALVTAAIVHPTGQGFALALSASSAALAAVSVAVVWRTVGIGWTNPRERGALRELLGFGLPLALSGLAGMFAFQIDRIVVSANFPPRDFAIYALGALEVPVGILLSGAVTNVLVPELSKYWRNGDRAGMAALWREAIRKTSLLLFPLFVFLMITAGDVIHVLYGAGYDKAVIIFRIYLFLIPLRIATWGLIPQSTGRSSVYLSASPIVILSNALIALTLVHPLGMIGPAIAGPVSTLIAALYFLLRTRLITGIGFRELLPLRTLASTLGVVTAAAAPLLPLQAVDAPPVVRLILGLAIFSATAVLMLRLTMRIRDEDWDRMLAAIAGLWCFRT
jgi:O-antigen/teichoic acid export membrane protein